MSEFNKEERKKFLLKFCKSSAIDSLKAVVSETIGKNVQCLFFDSDCNSIKNNRKDSRHISAILKKLKRTPLKEVKLINCLRDEECLAIPVKHGEYIYGYIIALHLKQGLSKKDLSFIKIFIDVALEDFLKEQELTRLYDTIRPRAIALSTIHTVHRLLTSTLDMDELIERIARLTLQVLRSKYCSIMLLDESKKYLIPKAVIDLKHNSGKLHKKYRKMKIRSSPVSKTAKTGNTFLSRNMICVPLIEEDVLGVICAKNKVNNAPFSNFDLEILLTLAEQAVIAITNAQLYEEQEKAAYGSIRSLVALLDVKFPNAYTHSERFVKIVLAIGEEMQLRREDLKNLKYAALLPDTGKFGIPDEILRKKGGLSSKEHAIIKKQHLESLKALEPLEFLKPAMPIIIHHHERYNGSGYPNGLKGKEIPIGARIMAVADAFEAMITSRPYKGRRRSITQALKEIRGNKHTQFDPYVVDAFLSVFSKPEIKKLFY
ncbi:MAG: GAF domain-containing protein [Candidatus Omnitrophica bacterium]|nr:GAF domain-containing protein [Candidatus Omnitrophota bacterium]